MRRLVLGLIVFILMASSGWCANVCTGDVSELMDIEKLAYLRDSICTQVSSYDRTGDNDDGFTGNYSYIRKEGDRQIIFDAEGPGCIYRWWTANADDSRMKIEVFFDGSDKPGIVFENYQDMFNDKVFPFVRPLSQRFIGGWCSYVPIPFEKHCKIVAHGAAKFLQINWQKFTSAVGVKTFATNFTDEYKAKVEAVKKLWNSPGDSAWGEKPPKGWRTRQIEVTVKAGQTSELLDLKGAGVVRGLYLTAGSDDSQFLRKSVLKISVDGGTKPNVWSPLGDFFIDGFGWPAAGTLLVGKRNSQYYSYWPMPYANGMGIDLLNDAASDVKLTVRAIVEPMKKLPTDMGRFYAWWHRQNPTKMGKSFEMLTARGRGHFCGVNHYMHGGAHVAFLEGDEMMWIDDRDNSYWNGTGTEDYFNGG